MTLANFFIKFIDRLETHLANNMRYAKFKKVKVKKKLICIIIAVNLITRELKPLNCTLIMYLKMKSFLNAKSR